MLQVKKIVGHAAPESFTLLVESLAVEHHAQLVVDCTRAYHFGTRFNVELEVILPAEMTVRESHDIALELQHKVQEPLQMLWRAGTSHRARAGQPAFCAFGAALSPREPAFRRMAVLSGCDHCRACRSKPWMKWRGLLFTWITPRGTCQSTRCRLMPCICSQLVSVCASGFLHALRIRLYHSAHLAPLLRLRSFSTCRHL